MIGSIYNYDVQQWDQIDTDTDPMSADGLFGVTPLGTKYEINPQSPEEYRNYSPVHYNVNGEIIA